MNKQQLIEQISEGADVSKSAATRMLDTFLRSVKTAVEDGDTVSLSNFGSFERVERKARVGRHIGTGERLSIPAQHVPVFQPSKQFKMRTNKHS